MGCIVSGGYLNPFELDPTLNGGMRVPLKGSKVEGSRLKGSKVDDLMWVDGLGNLEELPYLVKAEPC